MPTDCPCSALYLRRNALQSIGTSWDQLLCSTTFGLTPASVYLWWQEQYFHNLCLFLITIDLFQSLLIPSMKSVRGKNLRSSGDMQTTVSTQTAASVFTMGSEWSPWTWFPPTLRRPAPGSLGWNISWLVSVTKTVWPGGNVPVINILYPSHSCACSKSKWQHDYKHIMSWRIRPMAEQCNTHEPTWSLAAASHGYSRRSLRPTKTEMAPWALGRFTSCSTNSMWTYPSRKSERCFRWDMHPEADEESCPRCARPTIPALSFFYCSNYCNLAKLEMLIQGIGVTWLQSVGDVLMAVLQQCTVAEEQTVEHANSYVKLYVATEHCWCLLLLLTDTNTH